MSNLEKQVLFTVVWENGNQCVDDLIIKYCKENNIEMRINHFFKRELLINGEWITTDYKSIGNDKVEILGNVNINKMLRIYIIPEQIELNKEEDTKNNCLIPTKYVEINDNFFYIVGDFDDNRVTAIKLLKDKEKDYYFIDNVYLINETTLSIEVLNKTLFNADYYEGLRDFCINSEFHIAKQEKEEVLYKFILEMLNYKMWEFTDSIEYKLNAETICSIRLEVTSDKLSVYSYSDLLFEKLLYNFDIYTSGTNLIEKLAEILK